jgi:hypothetical protein
MLCISSPFSNQPSNSIRNGSMPMRYNSGAEPQPLVRRHRSFGSIAGPAASDGISSAIKLFVIKAIDTGVGTRRLSAPVTRLCH